MASTITQSSHIVDVEYDVGGEKKTVFVELVVYYNAGKYSVLPRNGEGSKFIFGQGSADNTPKRIAILDAIKKAVEIGNDLLEKNKLDSGKPAFLRKIMD